jgi:hypothetical protein
MAIRATIRSRKREEGFNIDIVAELVGFCLANNRTITSRRS